MIPGLSGSLLSHDALVGNIPQLLAAGDDPPDVAAAHRRIRAWLRVVHAEMGPACGARAVFDRVAWPLSADLGFRVALCGADGGQVLRALLSVENAPAAALIVTAWGHDPATAWRDAVRHGIGSRLRWCLCLTGPVLRVLDARRTYSRRFIEFDLAVVMEEPASFAIFWGLLRAGAFGRDPADAPTSLLERAVTLSEQHRTEVRASLQHGVHEALTHILRAFAAVRARRRTTRREYDRLFDESLIIVYRILFLLFAEARGLVPKWHPIYRDGYTVESLRASVEQCPRPRGLWESLQAIARLAHDGCEAGTLHVPPFNGRLFSPAHAPLADSTPLDDGAVRHALLALTTRPARGGRERIAYGDLGVEQLGGVYERVLDFQPEAPESDPRQLTLAPTGRRKATGSFYTPRSLTEYLVRRALAPLVLHATPEQILSLRVLDPAMGSGAFLVAACRYLAAGYEAALVRGGEAAATDIGDRERAAFRRTVAQRCLFGVDINPMAVQLGRLSLWLTTLAADKPLTFLDHHLRPGNSLIGASLDDVARARTLPRKPHARRASLPLFECDAVDHALSATVSPRLSIAHDSGDTIDQVRNKERLWSTLLRDDAPLARWKMVADLWCAAWFPAPGDGLDGRAGHRAFGALVDEILGRSVVLPRHVSEPLLAAAAATAARERFFHWTLEFPEVFYAPDGRPLGLPGFDAVIGNPPWDMLRGDRGDAPARRAAHDASSHLTAFARTSGTYALQGDGHANLYQLFFERALSLVRRGGRLGVVLPSGFASDHGCAALRRHALDRSGIDTFISVENRDGLFPIHRGLKFLLMTATAGGATAVLPCRFGVRAPDVLDQMPDAGQDDTAVAVSRTLLEQLSGGQLAIPELRCPTDLTIIEKISAAVPQLGDPAGWNVRFGRELNATDDRRHFTEAAIGRRRLLPVIEGKQIRPFAFDRTASRFHIPVRAAAALLDPRMTYRRARLTYRDVASATNRLTLIAAILPPGVVTTHTLFCLKSSVADDVQHFLCGMFNSFVANYLVRLRVGLHVTVSIIERLPVPVPPRDSRLFVEAAALSVTLARDPSNLEAGARLQSHAARLYGLTSREFQHVLDSFPLVDADVRRAAAMAFASEDAGTETGAV